MYSVARNNIQKNLEKNNCMYRHRERQTCNADSHTQRCAKQHCEALGGHTIKQGLGKDTRLGRRQGQGDGDLE